MSNIAHDETPAHLIGSADRAAWLAAGYCPDSGERLSLVQGWPSDEDRVLMCPNCDCFGYTEAEAGGV